MNRRNWVRWSLAAAAATTMAGAGFWATRGGAAPAALGQHDLANLRAVAMAVLQASLKDTGGASLQAWSLRFGELLQGLPEPTRAELADLLMLMRSGLGRAVLCGSSEDWAALPAAALRARLTAMRTSSLALRQQAYHALRDLTHAAFYAHPDTWADIGYGGPSVI